MPTWSARQYMQFEDERNRPIRELLAALPIEDARTVIDLGCGPGNSTELLLGRFPGAAARGIDTSPDMIAAARARLPASCFEVLDIESWLAGAVVDGAAGDAVAKYDVVFANAVLQWLPDHVRLFPALRAHLAPEGVLAVQMPDNLAEPAHTLMRDIASEGPWAIKLAPAAAARSSLESADSYHRLLHGAGCRVDIWRTTYYHVLPGGAAAIVEWFKGSGLRPFLAPLDESERENFLARYQAAVARAYPAMDDGSVMLPFPRLFLVAAA